MKEKKHSTALAEVVHVFWDIVGFLCVSVSAGYGGLGVKGSWMSYLGKVTVQWESLFRRSASSNSSPAALRINRLIMIHLADS